MKSPQTGLEALPTTTLYLQDPDTGLWFHPERDTIQPYPLFPTPSEDPASAALAEGLWRNVAKQEQGTELTDVAPATLGLVQTWGQNGDSNCSQYLQALPHPTPTAQKTLFTYVHTFQRLPYWAAEKELQCLASAGPNVKVFLRLPDHEVPGFERDLAPAVVEQNPCFYTLQSMLELLYQNGHFIVDETYTLNPGQRDWILRRVERRPTICVGMIAKNEERDLPVLLGSLKPLNLDGFCLIDTGSTDKTLEIARTAPAALIHTDTYTGASQPDEKGDWKLWDFGKARNQYCEWIERSGLFDWVLWMDADDQVLHPDRLRRLSIWTQYEVHGIMMESGGPSWPHHRLWKTGKGIRYEGRCHEYPHFGNAPSIVHSDIVIRHNAAPGAGENSNARNRRILEREMQEVAPTARTAFYLAQTYHHGGEPQKAVETYTKRIELGLGYEDEYWFAHLYRARCCLEAKNPERALQYVREAVVKRPDWAELWMVGAGIEMQLGRFWKAIGLALQAKDMPIPPTHLWRERDKYLDQPYRVISWCWEHLGLWGDALRWAEMAREKIGVTDRDWENRIDRIKSVLMKQKSTEMIQDKKDKKQSAGVQHVWYRPGALGDVLMTLNLVKAFRETHRPDRLIYRCAPGTKALLKPIILAAGFDEVVTDAVPGAIQWNLIGYPLAEGYPEKPMKRHLLEYFAAELLLDQESVLPRGEFSLPEVPKRFVTLHPQAGWSQYKNWPINRWVEIVARLNQRGVKVFQLGSPDDPKVPGALQDRRTDTFEQQFYTLGGAAFHMGVDSWSNHAGHFAFRVPESIQAKPVPSIILWGSTQSSAAGYPDNYNLSANPPCQPCFRENPKISAMPRGECPYLIDGLHPCMGDISVETVWAQVEKLLADDPQFGAESVAE